MEEFTNSKKLRMSFTLSTIAKDYNRLRRCFQPFSERYQGYLHQKNFNTSKCPTVLLLGNNGSGKSNFINHVLNRPVLSTGLQTTNDCFTVIKSGLEDFDGPGQFVVGDPELGFSEMQEAGPNLINNSQFKIRSNVANKDIMFVDGPNMLGGATLQEGQQSACKSGLEEACRWYADRADVVLVFVDPEDTLDNVRSALKGLGDKVMVILNKEDPYQPFQDFMHMYGSVCWNLAKSSPMKELPKIHTICPPVEEEWLDGTDATETSGFTNPRSQMMSSYCDQSHISLHESREAVVREVLNAPYKRVNNDINHLSKDVSSLLAHHHVMDVLASQYQSKLMVHKLVMGTALAASMGAPLFVHFGFDALRGTDIMNTITNSMMSCARELNSVVRELSVSDSVRATVQDWTKWAVSKPKESLTLLTSVVGAVSSMAVSAVSSYWLHCAAESLSSRSSYEKTVNGLSGQVMADAVKEELLASTNINVTPAMIKEVARLSQVKKREEASSLAAMATEVEQLKKQADLLTTQNQESIQRTSYYTASSTSSRSSVVNIVPDFGDLSNIDGSVYGPPTDGFIDEEVSYLSMTDPSTPTTVAAYTQQSTESNVSTATPSAGSSEGFWDDFYLQMGQPAPVVV